MSIAIADLGSSPRARGTRTHTPTGLPSARFIPACAGNTSASCVSSSSSAVHPRVRGEHIAHGLSPFKNTGSSPRARGTRLAPRSIAAPARFIPACAGNTSNRSICSRFTTVHPRVRGEHLAVVGVRVLRNGSSPRARGTRGAGAGPPGRQRFIPACAGNTRAVRAAVRPRPVHPRVRGEHKAIARPRSVASGSSPRARGTLFKTRAAITSGRFIPACAGNTYRIILAIILPPVHPRVRGEHFPCPHAHAKMIGSSPRARGTPIPTPRVYRPLRFIPACAGNTCLEVVLKRPQSVHPRVRGEHTAPAFHGHSAIGSSPRARGTPAWRYCHSKGCAVHPRVRGEHYLSI